MENKDTLSLELTRTINVHHENLKPFGKFTIKFKTRQGHKPKIIPLNELEFDYNDSMPVSDEQDKLIVKFMKKNKTDILWDGSYRGFYTRCGRGFTKIYHKKLDWYRDDWNGFKSAVDED